MDSTTTPIPIVFNHRHEPQTYLLASVLQARFTNPSAPIVLFHDFGEVPSELSAHGIQCLHVRDFYGDCAKLDSLWFNISRHPSEYERGAMQRWLILRNYMRDAKLSQVFAVDSDVLLFCDVGAAHKNFGCYDFTVCDQTWSCALFNNLRALDAFHDFVIELYERKTSLWWKTLGVLNVFNTDQPIGNLADTVLIKMFVNEVAPTLGLSYANTAQIVDGSAFCPDLRSEALPCEREAEGIEVSDPRPLRRIFWVNGLPHAKHHNGELIRMNCLHFRGNLKHGPLAQCFVTWLEAYKAQQSTQIFGGGAAANH